MLRFAFVFVISRPSTLYAIASVVWFGTATFLVNLPESLTSLKNTGSAEGFRRKPFTVLISPGLEYASLAFTLWMIAFVILITS